jgi:hypothetical protein
VPAALFDRFEPEPRGSSDRRRALDDAAPVLGALAARTSGDTDLRDVSARLLGARARLLATGGDRTLAERAASDAAAFAP